MNFRTRIRCRWLVAILMLGMAETVVATDSALDRLRNGNVLLLRHAIAPGFGDPAGFRIDDCSTQRNLSEAGRQQARAIGAWLRARGISRAKVYSSQWCRCLETARLLNLGPVTQLPALNSFFESPDDREPNLAATKQFILENSHKLSQIQPIDHTVIPTQGEVDGVTNM